MATALLAGCSSEDEITSHVPEGKTEVYPVLPGVLGILPQNGVSSRYGSTRADGERADGENDIFSGKDPSPLPDGSTLWLYVQETTANGTEGTAGSEKEKYIKSYVVHNIDAKRQALYPCKVTHDEDGNVTAVEETNVPLYLTVGKTYTFRAMSPAKKLVDTDEGEKAVDIKNKEYLMANDDRYPSSSSQTVTIDEGGNHITYVKLNSLAHQTAQLEFTIAPDEKDKNIFSLDVMPQGIEISGVQSYHKAEGETHEWNLRWTGEKPTYLEPKVGDNNERFTIRRSAGYADSFIENKSNTELYIKCPILPTDAYSTSIIVLFNLSVNGIPTQYKMMLNQKVYEAAYTYHYKGIVKLEGGSATITWQYVNWNEELPIL